MQHERLCHIYYECYQELYACRWLIITHHNNDNHYVFDRIYSNTNKTNSINDENGWKACEHLCNSVCANSINIIRTSTYGIDLRHFTCMFFLTLPFPTNRTLPHIFWNRNGKRAHQFYGNPFLDCQPHVVSHSAYAFMALCHFQAN